MREAETIRLYLDVKIALDHQCPVCGSHDFRLSRKTGWLPAALGRLSIDIDRCRQCHHHFLLPRVLRAQDQHITAPAAVN